MNKQQLVGVSLLAFLAVAGGVLFWSTNTSVARHKRSVDHDTSPLTTQTDFRIQQWNDLIKTEFAGDLACASCHSDQFAAHQRSGHSHTLAPMASSQLARDLKKRGHWRDPHRNQSFEFTLEHAHFRVSRENRAIRVNWLVGSGKHAQTPVATDAEGRRGVEIRLTAFGERRKLGLTPDHDRFDSYGASSEECFGRPMDSSDVRSCLGCHSTAIPPSELPLNESELILNVSCERCHGPRKAHVTLARMGRAEAARPMLDLENAEIYMDICSGCHRDERSVQADAPKKDRVRFQPYGLKRSRCYVESAGAMTCSTCHDPHDAPSLDRRAYRDQCQRCHQELRSAVCPTDPRGDCIACHMPEVEWTAGITFHDHFIHVPDVAKEGDRPLANQNSTSLAPIKHGYAETLYSRGDK